ncbi:MAG: TetR/AcrR family transcriptional regulator [Nocardioidaceae bacterium]|nr:TetR/AcrR family transcriptional regulator [Nocardioidaceae bacterium]
MTSTEKRRGRPPSGGREEILKATLELLRERGMARLTTREVASRAGVSEGSVFYHFEDRFGLLKAVFERSLEPLHLQMTPSDADDLAATVTQLSEVIERFLTASVDVMMAAQSDAELRDALHAFMADVDYGPHRGIASIAGYVAVQQQRGIVRADVDAKVIASIVVNDAFQRATVPKLVGNRKGIQPRATFVETLTAMLQPKS